MIIPFIATWSGIAGEPTPIPPESSADNIYIQLESTEKGTPLKLQTPIIHFVPQPPQPDNINSQTDTGQKSGTPEKRPGYSTKNSGTSPDSEITTVSDAGNSDVVIPEIPTDVTVDLIGAIHIADPEYYDVLNDRFQEYDAVIFEMILPRSASKNSIVTDYSESSAHSPDSPLSLVTSIQIWMKNSLKYAFQIEKIRYDRPNMIHGDMDLETFQQMILETGDLTRIIYESAADSFLSQDPTYGWLAAVMFSKDRTTVLRRIMARELVKTFDQAALQEREDTLIHARNQIALRQLRQEIQEGKKKIAIFYGVAHLPNFAKSLELDFHLKQDRIQWLTAWRMTGHQETRRSSIPKKAAASSQTESVSQKDLKISE